MRVNDRYRSFYYETDDDVGKVEINPRRTALLIVDMQNFFVGRPVNMEARWKPFFDRMEEVIIPNNQRILALCREKKIEVVYATIVSGTKDGRERSLDHRSSGFNDLLLRERSKEAQIVDELAPQEDEIVVKKTTDSALTGTNLRLILHNMGIDTVIVTGVYTDQCISCTVRSLADESFRVWLIEDACLAATQAIQQNELEILNNIYCHVINTQELCGALNTPMEEGLG